MCVISIISSFSSMRPPPRPDNMLSAPFRAVAVCGGCTAVKKLSMPREIATERCGFLGGFLTERVCGKLLADSHSLFGEGYTHTRKRPRRKEEGGRQTTRPQRSSSQTRVLPTHNTHTSSAAGEASGSRERLPFFFPRPRATHPSLSRFITH